jgi:Uncharacterized conserved protein (DUF2163)
VKTVTGGNGSDTTAAVQAWLAANRSLMLRNLYLIGELEDPAALWLTDHESPLEWSAWGTFLPSNIKRGTVSSKIGLEVPKLTITWSPKLGSFTSSIGSASPYQLAQIGMYDNWKVRVWRCFMPTPGDANTFGACELFGGRIGATTIARGKIEWQVTSFLDVVNQKIPPNVIETTNTLASFKGANPPPGLSRIPQFNVISGSTSTVLLLDCTFPTAHQIFPSQSLNRGYLVFNGGAGATLAGVFRPIGANQNVLVGGVHYNQVQIYDALPWPPTPGVDTCFVSAAFPLNQADGDYFGFPYVPDPETAA